MGFLIKDGIRYKVIKYEGILIEEGRVIGIEINNTRIHTVYLPVNTEPQDKIMQHYEGLSEIIAQGLNENRDIAIVGDFNSHIRNWCHVG